MWESLHVFYKRPLGVFHGRILYYTIFTIQVSFTVEYYNLVTGDSWHMKRDKWHMRYDTWHFYYLIVVLAATVTCLQYSTARCKAVPTHTFLSQTQTRVQAGCFNSVPPLGVEHWQNRPSGPNLIRLLSGHTKRSLSPLYWIFGQKV